MKISEIQLDEHTYCYYEDGVLFIVKLNGTTISLGNRTAKKLVKYIETMNIGE
jgi:hypothetical protein